MCGIAGIAYPERSRPVASGLLRAMSDSLRHRGPDDDGLFRRDGVGLVMRRLSIIDITGGQQPIFNEDGTKAIVFNGEIYNYRELSRELTGRGHVFRSRGDAETVLHLYEELGPGCVERLRGMFAFAIWDDATDTLLLARDRFGIKPLYVTAGPWGIAFASELKALQAADLIDGRFSWMALQSYFQLGYIPAPASPFENVHKLEPGHLLLWRRGREPVVTRYWDLPTHTSRSIPDLERSILEWLDESVRAHLVSDVPIAAFLSGGLDSSAVVASMCASGGSVHAYTARYRGSGARSADETGLASLLTERYGAHLTVVDIEPDVRDLLEPIVYGLDEPHADESAVPTWLIAERVAADYKVALVGTGGDELFAGYRRHIGVLVADLFQRLPRGARRTAGELADLLPETRGSNLSINRLKRFLRTDGSSLAERYFAMQRRIPDRELELSLYSPALRDVLGTERGEDRFRSLSARFARPPGLRTALYLDYKTYLPDDILHLADRLGMAHSIEVRVPFVDHLFVERAFPIPDRRKIGWGRKKHLLRRALRRRLPAPHLRAPKRGFVGPTAAWLRNELRPLLEDELSAARVRRLGYFEPVVVERLMTEHFSGRHNREGVLWALLCFSVWHRLFAERHATVVREDARRVGSLAP